MATKEEASAKKIAPGKKAAVADFEALEPRARLTDLAYETLEQAIVTLKLPPGLAISEQALSTRTGIGRTPIREAIQRLAREHLITVLPQRGLLIADVDVGKQLRLLETRRELERLICRSAARRANPLERARFAQLADAFSVTSSAQDSDAFMQADREFNELCLAAAHNEFAEAAMRGLHGLSRRFWFMHYKQSPDLHPMGKLHSDLAHALSRGEVDAAGQALDHLVDFIEQYTRSMVMSNA